MDSFRSSWCLFSPSEVESTLDRHTRKVKELEAAVDKWKVCSVPPAWHVLQGFNRCIPVFSFGCFFSIIPYETHHLACVSSTSLFCHKVPLSLAREASEAAIIVHTSHAKIPEVTVMMMEQSEIS